MSEEIELAAKAFGDTVGELTERAGLTGPPRELAGFLTSYIHPRREAFAAKQLVAAAEKIKRAGIPPRAVPDETLRALVEGGSLADDEDMQERGQTCLQTHSSTIRPRFRRRILAFFANWNQSRQHCLIS